MATFRRTLVALLIVTGPSAAQAQNRSLQRPASLLKKLSLPDASISGSWARTPDGGVRSTSSAPARLWLGRAPEGEYDLVAVFTRQESEGRLGLLLSYDGIDFGWFTEQGRNPASSGFAMLDDRDQWDSADRSLQNIPADAKKRTVRFKVRRNGVTAWLARKKIGEVTDYYDLAPLDDKDSVGEGSLGILSDAPSVVIHAVTLSPVVESAGDDSKSVAWREPSGEPADDEAGSSNDLLPITSTWNGVRTTLNRHGDIHCNMKVIDRNGPLVVMRMTERGCTMRWTFSLSRGNLILQKFRQESGAGSITNVQAVGSVSPGQIRINYQWVYSGSRAANAIVVGSIYLEQD